MTTRTALPTILATAFAVLSTASSAIAMSCAPRDSLARVLSMQHGEQPISGGLQGDRHIVEVFVSEEDDTWTILVTQTNGLSCIIAAGTDWTEHNILPAGIPG